MDRLPDYIKVVRARMIEKTERNCLIYLKGKTEMMRFKKEQEPEGVFEIQGQKVRFLEVGIGSKETTLLIGYTGNRDAAWAGIVLRMPPRIDDGLGPH